MQVVYIMRKLVYKNLVIQIPGFRIHGHVYLMNTVPLFQTRAQNSAKKAISKLKVRSYKASKVHVQLLKVSQLSVDNTERRDFHILFHISFGCWSWLIGCVCGVTHVPLTGFTRGGELCSLSGTIQ